MFNHLIELSLFAVHGSSQFQILQREREREGGGGGEIEE